MHINTNNATELRDARRGPSRYRLKRKENVFNLLLFLPSGSSGADGDDIHLLVEPHIGATTPSTPVATATDRPIEAEREDIIPTEYKARILELEQFAEEDGGVVDAASKASFFQFLAECNVVAHGSLVLNHANHLCAKWWDEGSDQDIGAEFAPDGRVLYVIKKRAADGKLTTDVEKGTSIQFVAAVSEAGLSHLLYP